MPRTSRLAAVLALLVVSTLVGASARADEDVVEAWDRIHVAGSPSGFAHTIVRRVGGEAPRVESTAHTSLRLQRMGQTTEIESTTETWESPEGALLRIAATSKLSAQESRSVFTFADGKVTIETTVMGNTRSVEREVPAGLVGPVHAEAGMKALSGTEGKAFEYTTFLADFQATVRSVITSKGPETVELTGGSSAELTRLEVKSFLESGAAIPMSPVVWIDAAGAPLKTFVSVSGMVIESFRVADEAAARSDGGTAKPAPDVFEASMIQEDGPVPVPRRLEEAWIVVTRRGADVPLPEIADAGHTVTEREDGSLLVHARRRTPPDARQGVRPLARPSPELADALAPSSMIQSDATEIAALAAKAVGAQTNAWKAAQALERWVHDAISKKGMGVAFGSALEVCRSREGDCTEHALLLAALCRAAGIPARVVMGVEQLYGIWGGHAWNEVWIEGEWYPLDATNGLGFVDPLHLPVARMNLKDGGGSELVQLLGSLGSIDVDVTEVVRDGRRIAIDDPSLVTTEGGAYTDRALGISFRAPAGWMLDAPKRGQGIQTRIMELDGRTAAGGKVEIEVEMLDAPARSDWEGILGELRIDASGTDAGKVDGRESRRFGRSGDGASDVRVAVVADGALWLFRLDRADGEAERKAFDEFLASVDFDVK